MMRVREERREERRKGKERKDKKERVTERENKDCSFKETSTHFGMKRKRNKG